MKAIRGKSAIILEADLKRREKRNRDYLMSLSKEDLLFTYNMEAGR